MMALQMSAAAICPYLFGGETRAGNQHMRAVAQSVRTVDDNPISPRYAPLHIDKITVDGAK